MKRLLFLPVVLALAVLVSGCAGIARKSAPPRPRAFALAVTVHGSLQPTPAQYAAIQAAAAKELAAMGLVLVSDLSLADRIIRVDFTPNPANPEHSGRAIVIGLRANPYRALGHISYVPASEKRIWNSYSYYYDPMRSYSGYSDGYIYDAPSGVFTPINLPAAPPRRDEPPPPDAGRAPSERVAVHTREDYPRSNRGLYPRYPRLPPTPSSSDSGSSSGGTGSSDSSSYSSSHDSSSSGGSSFSSSYSSPDSSDISSFSRGTSDSRGNTVDP